MEFYALFHSSLIAVVCLLNAGLSPTNAQLAGCSDAGYSDCCMPSGSDSCLVQKGECFCDVGCYDTSDCCEDIASICPRNGIPGRQCNSGPRSAPGTGDDVTGDDEGSGSGSGDGSGGGVTTEPPPTTTVPPPSPPMITSRPDNPDFVLPLTNMTRLTIIITRTSGSTVEWRKDGEVINSLVDPRVTILSAGGISIRNIRLTDRGTYTVTVSNSAGSDMANFTLALSFINIVDSTADVTPEAIQLSCTAVGYPEVNLVAWQTPTGLNISGSTENENQSSIETTVLSTLIVDPASCVSGEYRCLFDNGNGSIVLGFTPTVQCPQVEEDVELGFEKSVYIIDEGVADNADVSLKVCVTQIGDTPQGVESATITMATQSGSASEGTDFVSTSVTRTLPLPLPSQSPDACLCINILPEAIVESTEQFSVVLSSSDQHIRIPQPTALVRIVNDDTITANLERSEYTVSEGAGEVEVCVVLTGSFQRQINVFLCTEGGTAVDGVDYTGLSAHRFSFPASSPPTNGGRQCTNIRIIEDSVSEGDKMFNVKIQTDPNDPVITLGATPSATVTITNNDPGPPSAEFVNDTPNVLGNNITVEYLISDSRSELTSVVCRLVGPGRTPPVVIEDCSSGHAEFTGLPMRYQMFIFTLEGRLGNETVVLARREVRLDIDVCWLHPINQGVVIVNGTTAVAEWQGTGPSLDNKVSSFLCRMDRERTDVTCSPPYMMESLSPGPHTLTVTPAITTGCRRRQPRIISFNMEA